MGCRAGSSIRLHPISLPDDAPLHIFLKPLPPEQGEETLVDESQVEK